jgi:hypothetical protein
MPGLRADRATTHSTTSVSKPVSRSRNGAGKDGYIRTIHAAGSNGTAAIIWGDEWLTRTLGRSNAGRQSAVTSDSFSMRASLVICHAADGNGRRSCIGPTTAGNCKETSRSRALDDAWPEVLSPSPIAAAARWSTEASQPAQSLLAQRRAARGSETCVVARMWRAPYPLAGRTVQRPSVYFSPHQSKMPPMRPTVSNAFSASCPSRHKTP